MRSFDLFQWTILPLLACLVLSSGCWDSADPDLRVTVRSAEVAAEGTIQIQYRVGSQLVVNHSAAVEVPVGQFERILEIQHLPGEGDLIVRWEGRDHRNATRQWTNWRPGHYPDSIFVRVLSQEIQFSTPTP